MAHFLTEQGVDLAQPTTFLSDGGETVRIAQGNFRDFGEPILDWFHIAMRITVLSQTLKGVRVRRNRGTQPKGEVPACGARKLSSGTEASTPHVRFWMS